MTNPTATPPAILRLRGHEPQPAEIAVEPRPRQTRLVRSLATLGGFLLLAPLVFFIPPHIPWVLLALGAGLYFGRREWVGEYVVHSFSGRCPRCDAELSIKPGDKVRFPLELDCYNCHHKPTVALGEEREF